MNDTFYKSVIRLTGVTNGGECTVEYLHNFFQLTNLKTTYHSEAIGYSQQTDWAFAIWERWSVALEPTDKVRVLIDEDGPTISFSTPLMVDVLTLELVGPDLYPVVVPPQALFVVTPPTTREVFLNNLRTNDHYALTGDAIVAIERFFEEHTPRRAFSDVRCCKANGYLSLRLEGYRQCLVLFAYPVHGTKRSLITPRARGLLSEPSAGRYPTPLQFTWLKARSALYAQNNRPACDPAVLPVLDRIEARSGMTAVYSCEGHVGTDKEVSIMIACRDGEAVQELEENFFSFVGYLERNTQVTERFARHIARHCTLTLKLKSMPPECGQHVSYPIYVLSYPLISHETKDLFFEVLDKLFLRLDSQGHPVP